MVKGRGKKKDRSREAQAPHVSPFLGGDGAPPVIEPVEVLGPEPDEKDAPNEESLSDLEPISIAEIDGEVLEVDADQESKGIVSLDPLTRYLQEASRNAPLSREEEYQLAVKYHQDHDRDAAYRLVVSNLWLVIKVAREYERAARNMLDLIQEGNIGLMEAVKSFDPYRGVRFPSYAVWWIKAYIIRFIIANWRMVKIGTTQAQRKLFFNLRKEKERLEREGFLPAPKLLAERLNVKEDEVIEMEQRLGSSDMSVDAPLQDDNEQTLHSVLASQDQSIEDKLAKVELRKLLAESFSEFEGLLNEKEQVIFRERMLGDDKVTLQDISEKLSVSRERVRQIENRIKERLKVFLSERLGEELPEDLEIY